jgi:hypothetical protein
VQSPTIAATHGLSVVIFLLFLSTMLTAQVKINERVEINSDEFPLAPNLTLGYPATLIICQVGECIGNIQVLLNHGEDEAVFYQIKDSVTGEPNYMAYYKVKNIISAGTGLTFTDRHLGETVEYPLVIREVESTECGGWWELLGNIDDGVLIRLFLQAGRTSPLPPYHISFDFSSSLNLMYTDSQFVPIHLFDCCGYSQTPAPVVYRVEITQGKEWCSLYDEASGKRGTVIDSLNSPDGWSSFYIEALGEEPSEPQQGSLTVSSYGNVIPPLTYDFLITPYQRTLQVTPGRKDIIYGDTTILASNPTGEELLDAQYSIIKGNAYSTLQSLDSTVIGDTIDGVFPSAILRTMDDVNAPDSISILIKTVATVPCPECGGGATKIASKDSSKDIAIIRKELLSQRLKRLPATVQTKMQSIMQMKSNENQPHTTSSLKALDNVMSLSQTTKSSLHHLNKIRYDGFTNQYYGLTEVTVRKPVLKILDHSPWTIWPYLPPQNDGASRGADLPGYKPKRAFTIQVLKKDGTPLPNKRVKIATSFTSQSGGHQHTNGTIELPLGLTQGWFYGQGYQKVNPIILITDANGLAVIDSFIASQASGKFLITARMQSDTTVFDTVNIQVKVPGFVEFGTGDYWYLSGSIPNHPSNHWCVQTMKDSLSAALNDFYDWSGSKEGKDQYIKLGVNDMSLTWGGLFDIDGDWNIDNPSHSFHRVGLSVDINNTGDGDIRYEDGTLTEKGKKLREYMKKYGGKKYPEEKIHFGFNGGN